MSVSIEDASSFKKGVNQTYCVISIISNSSYTSTSVVSGKGCRIFIIIIFPRQLLISTDASLEGWKAFCQGQKTKGFLDIFRKVGSYQYTGVKGTNVCKYGFHLLGSYSKTSSHTNRQYCCPFVFGNYGW